MRPAAWILVGSCLAAAIPAWGQSSGDEGDLTLDTSNTGAGVRALLVPRVESVLSSQITAQITNLPLSEGERFEQGDILVEFRCEETRAELLKSQADLRAASSTHEANLRLREHNAVSTLEVDVSKARADQARADVALWQARIAHCTITAPFPGRVAAVVAKPFETVTQGAPLIEILDDRELTMQLNVPSAWLAWLERGTAFEVNIDETRKSYAATVTELGARVDPVSQTLPVKAVINGRHEELLAGMSGVARFVGR